MPTTVKIENTEFVRDMGTKAVLNTDVTGLQRYKENRRKTLRQNQESKETKERLALIETEMVALKQLVSELVGLRKV